MRVFLFACLALTLGLAFLGCGGGGSPVVDAGSDAPAAGAALAAVATVATAEPYATLTPWPTFTPLPTPSSVLPTPTLPQASARAAATEAATPAPIPTPTPLPTVALAEVNVVAPDLLATPTPTPLQLVIPDTDVVISRQTLFMSQVGQPPDFWPRSQTEFYTRTARYIGWFIELDYSNADPGFRMAGLLRWLNVTTGREHVIFQRPYVMDAAQVLEGNQGETLFFMMGKDVPGFWTPGIYRVELWDNRDRVVARYRFSVLSGVTN